MALSGAHFVPVLAVLVVAAGCEAQLDGKRGGGASGVRLVDDGSGPAGASDDGTEPPLDGDPCAELDYLGECDADIARWCEDGEYYERDCTAAGQRCGWIDDTTGYYCGDGFEPDPEPGTDPSGPDPSAGCGTPSEMQELALTNEARLAAGLLELACDDALTRAARAHSEDMCDRGYFSHRSIDGRAFTDRIDEQGASYTTAGENIAWGQQGPEDAHAAWMASPGHRSNILGTGYRRVGIGYAPCGGMPFWTQDFTD